MMLLKTKIYHLLAGIFLCGAIFAGPSKATETVTYTYDELGRLVQTQHSGSANDSLSTDIEYDPAGNRTSYETDNSANGANNPSADNIPMILPNKGKINVPFINTDDSGVTGEPGEANAETPPSFSIGDANATEGGSLTFTVTKSEATGGKYSVDWGTSDDTAINGSDYIGGIQVLTFEGATTSLPIVIDTIDDEIFESTEAFTLTLTGASGGATIATATGTGTITNDTDYPNAPPNAVDDSGYAVGVCEAVTINVVANDNDSGDTPQDLPLTIISVSNPNLGQAAKSGTGMITFTAFNQTGATNFTYTIQDARGAQASASVAITVNNSGPGCQ